MEHWRLIVAIGIHALMAASAVSLCAPANRERVRGWQLFLAGVSGILLGLAFIEPPYVFPGESMAPFPFDPNQTETNPFGDAALFENFAVGVGVPFILLALWVSVRRKGAGRSLERG
jgi:hypothetical protein